MAASIRIYIQWISLEKNKELKGVIMENIVERLISVINTLNKIEIKGFENIMNLGLSIQELNNIATIINQNQ